VGVPRDTVRDREYAQLSKQNKWLQVFASALFIFPAVSLIFVALEYLLSDAQARHFHYWFQAICGDWAQDIEKYFDRKSLEFGSVLAAQLLLALAPIGAIFGIFWWIVNFEKRRQVMRYIDLISIRDTLIMREIMNQTPVRERNRMSEVLLKAFEETDKKFQTEELPNFFTPDLVIKVREELYQDIIKRVQ
jgi:hypothetical protein